jgi:clan AA aspartic protease
MQTEQKQKYALEELMGFVYAPITLQNAGDKIRVEGGLIKENEIREIFVNALVDTGSGTLVINEEIRQKLGLEVEGLRQATFANESKETCKLTEPVKIIWKDRDAVCRALVVPNNNEVLLGAIPIEDMDLVVNPAKRELIGAHGNEIVCYVK